jgi:hypothetical protein
VLGDEVLAGEQQRDHLRGGEDQQDRPEAARPVAGPGVDAGVPVRPHAQALGRGEQEQQHHRQRQAEADDRGVGGLVDLRAPDTVLDLGRGVVHGSIVRSRERPVHSPTGA